VQAKILDTKPDELKISLLQWMENVERKDLSLAERLKNLEKMLSAYALNKGFDLDDVTATDVGRLLGCSLPHAMNYISVMNADTKVKELIRTNKLKNLEKAALIATIRSDGIKQEAIEACLAGATLKKLKSISAKDKSLRSTFSIHCKRLISISAQDKVKKMVITHLSPDMRGRQPSLVNLGSTRKIPVAKLIIDSILSHEKVNHLKQHFSELNWTDYKSINHAFKQLIKTLEKIEA